MRRIALAERDPAADPGVLLVGAPALELDEHPEAAGIDVAGAEDAGERLDRAVRDERGRMGDARPARLVAADEPDLAAEEVGEGRTPRPDHDVAHPGALVDRGHDGLGELDRVLDDRAVREREPQDRGLRVGPRRDLDERALDQLVDQAVRRVDDEEPPVLEDALLLEADLVAVLQPEAAHGRDAETADGRHPRMLADRGETPRIHIRKTPKRVSGIGAWSAASMPIVRMRRVSSGSMTPSSQSRAVAKYGEPSRS